jgi:3-hydroxy-9,10-secoandrosta-1,3,5(10)-triene-9,17-dione monooxygenase
MFPPKAQDEIWRVSPDTLIASSFVFPAGRARPVEGGYLVSGRWPFSSGVDPSDWNMLGGLSKLEDNAPPEQRVFLLHRSQYKILDTWYRGRAARHREQRRRSARAVRAEHRTLAVADMKGGPTPGSAVNPSPLYQIPVFAMFPYMLSGVALGCAEGLIDNFSADMVGRAGKMTGARISEVQSVQIRLARRRRMRALHA